MSGRKGCEVASVLNQTEDIQKTIFSSYKNEINREITDIENLNREIQSNRNLVQNYTFQDMENIQKELVYEFTKMTQKISLLKTGLSEFQSENTSSFLNELSQIENGISSENQKAQILRDAIRNSSHYVDSEYAQAQTVKANIEKLKTQYQKLKSTVSKARENANRTNQKIISKSQDLKDIDNSISKLDIQAKNIKKIRNEANSLKKDISDNFLSIDKIKAEKFAKDKLVTLKKDISNFESHSNEQIIKTHSKISANITELKAFYNESYNSWLAEKTSSENYLKSVGEKGSKTELTLLEDLVNGNDVQISKLGYFDNYKGTKHSDKFSSLISKAKSMLNSENFDSCNSVLNEAKSLYEKISNEADKIRENIESSANLAFKIRKVMLSDEVNFRKAKLEIIDGNPLNGFRLDCQNGDTINFEEIKIDEKGDVVINLDHIENTNGTCGVRWGQMKQVFNNEGIPLTDVLKDGNSVIYRDVRRKESKSKTQKRG